MFPTSWLRRWRDPPLCALVAAILALLLHAGSAVAQTKPSPPPSVLIDVSAADIGPDKTRLVLTFSPAAPTWSILKADPQRPQQTSIGFALSSRGDSAHMPPGLSGLVRGIEFEQQDTILILRLNTTRPAQIVATKVSDQVISLTIAPPTPVKAHAETAEAAAGPLPKAADPPAGEDGFAVVPLKYADVSEVVGLLTAGLTVKSNDDFEPHEPAFGSAGMNGSNYTAPPPPGPDAVGQPMAQSVDDAIGVDRRLNAIILKGSPQRIARLKAEIEQIDVPVDSVWLETMFVELTEHGAKNVGLDFNNANNQIGVATFQTGQYIPAGANYGNTSPSLSSVALQAAIYAQVQKGEGRIVSKPRISAQSGSSAKIITGDALPILTAITLSGVNGVSQQVQYVNVGVTLQIAPRVSSDGYVTSHVFCVVSSVTGYSQGYPTISQREASTSATVHDGETFVIGGLTQENDISNRTRIPGLGDIPGAGGLFRLSTGTSSKTELYIVVTPHIVRRGEAASLPPETARAAGMQ
jgi:general secretion pathway protein D